MTARPSKPVSVRVKRNIWGNWNAYEGVHHVRELGVSEFMAREWLHERMSRGDCVLSPSSDVNQTELDEHRRRVYGS
ncbi:hypothetical protein H1O16_gp012 [Burkholderia phage BcepSaruman]|uniref:Uncharacterized protein n=1 Tax=Burkholderia phage BcepSaruman TaxID=2530032 RepID=A0A4D5ZBR6_9CAUD|nr:hypothetical protein H1O16_gp012 [Burkholderia phage BcepSaruman]QBX06425.1 hypothetical protein BcepSaruman_012 [Burkholderia phage BcepSaruman]